ncbi:MAG TPA: undecaprenyldiphospho-muramoylpentapeptide beta-N-acetylglucosaminyltransferase [Cytophagaceae bacterium]|jgi:UDP-N-acetylglucosamine--N-acetylmuramyl-(pentapeptide) pyrophosphoryl-undecaprenol N-acetylglucosamine transferase|nr:undecaprenyldiphospho-muramoylpentapeptide beta-N-acetylglucosaminyltransferase [Cytophagaceae bacterium]
MTYRIMISGGGTGGHIFPAVAVAEEWMNQYPQSEILFVGADGKMEMQKVPDAGFKIVGLPIRGLQRKLTMKNLLLPFYIIRSLVQSFRLLSSFKPHVVAGFGGYASAPLLFTAAIKGIPIVIQEQNSYAGLANKVLSRWAKRICVAYDNMQYFFPKEKLVHTGNPIRLNVLKSLQQSSINAKSVWGLKEDKKTILVIGGSLGATTINKSVEASLELLKALDVQLIWQTGNRDTNRLSAFSSESVKVTAFIQEMDKAYAAADFIVSRAGAIAVSELTLVGKPVILIPSPNVTEDHQTKNAMALVKKDAALLVKDVDAVSQLGKVLSDLVKDKSTAERIAKNISSLAKPNAAKDIVALMKKEIN